MSGNNNNNNNRDGRCPGIIIIIIIIIIEMEGVREFLPWVLKEVEQHARKARQTAARTWVRQLSANVPRSSLCFIGINRVAGIGK